MDTPTTCPLCKVAKDLCVCEEGEKTEATVEQITEQNRHGEAWPDGAWAGHCCLEQNGEPRCAKQCSMCADGVDVPACGWRPISTAPRDGSRILLWWKYRPARVGWWTDEESGTGWKCDGDVVVPCAAAQSDATHWQPVPGSPFGVMETVYQNGAVQPLLFGSDDLRSFNTEAA